MKRRLMILVVAAFACFAVPSLTADGPAIGTSLEVEGDYQFPNHEATDTSGFAPIVMEPLVEQIAIGVKLVPLGGPGN